MRYLFFTLLLTTYPVFGQFRDRCTDFTLSSKYCNKGVRYFGEFNNSYSHREWNYSWDMGVGGLTHHGGPSYSRIGILFCPKVRLTDHWIIQQNWILQLHNPKQDSLFKSKDLSLDLSGVINSVGYEIQDRSRTNYTYVGIGTGTGMTFTRTQLPVVILMKTRSGLTPHTYLQVEYLWTLNNILDVYDDNIMLGLSWGFHWKSSRN